jgi:type II secretory pathway component PulJ
MFRSLRNRVRSDRGTTVVELLVTMAVMSIIVGAVITVWNAAQKGESTATSRSVDLNAMRLSMQQMTKDIRQASRVHTQTASSFDADTYIEGVKHRVAYTASGTTLTRKVDGGTAVTLLSNLADANVFTYTTDGNLLLQVTVLLTIDQTSGEGTLNLQSDVQTRNLTS